MKTIAILAQKGGSGKSTTSISLAVAAHLDGKSAAIIDLDPQRSVSAWKELRSAPEPAVVPATANKLVSLLDAALDAGADLAVIDTPPHSTADAMTAAKLADLVVIPCRPGFFDVSSVQDTTNIVKLANKPAVVVLTFCRSRSPLTRDAERVLEQIGLRVAPVTIGDRIAYNRAITEGMSVQEFEPGGKAAREVARLNADIRACLDGSIGAC